MAGAGTCRSGNGVAARPGHRADHRPAARPGDRGGGPADRVRADHPAQARQIAADGHAASPRVRSAVRDAARHGRTTYHRRSGWPITCSSETRPVCHAGCRQRPTAANWTTSNRSDPGRATGGSTSAANLARPASTTTAPRTAAAFISSRPTRATAGRPAGPHPHPTAHPPLAATTATPAAATHQPKTPTATVLTGRATAAASGRRSVCGRPPPAVGSIGSWLARSSATAIAGHAVRISVGAGQGGQGQGAAPASKMTRPMARAP